MSWKRWLITAASFAAAIGVSLYIVLTSWPKQGAPVALPPGAHALALVVLVVELLTRGLKIRLSAAALRVPLDLGASLRTVLAGDFGGGITPSRSGSEPARYLVLQEAGVPVASAILILFAELVQEMVSLAVVAVGLALFLEGGGAALGGLVGLVGGYAAFVLGLGGAGIVLARRNASGPPPTWARRLGLHAGRWRTVQRSLRQLRLSVDSVREAHRGYMLAAFIVSIIHVVMKLTLLPIIVWSLDRSVPLAPLVLWPLALFYGSVVVPSPGGGGVVEVAYKATLGRVIPASIFATTLIWWRVYSFYAYLVLGAIAAGNTALRALRDDPEKPKKPRVYRRRRGERRSTSRGTPDRRVSDGHADEDR